MTRALWIALGGIALAALLGCKTPTASPTTMDCYHDWDCPKGWYCREVPAGQLPGTCDLPGGPFDSVTGGRGAAVSMLALRIPEDSREGADL